MMVAGSRIDAHLHVWDLGVRDQDWTIDLPSIRRNFGINDVSVAFSSNAIAGGVLIQTAHVVTETKELLLEAEGSSSIVGVVGWVDLCAPNAEEELRQIMESPGGQNLVGLRHIAQSLEGESWFEIPAVIDAVALVGKYDLTFDILAYPNQLPAVVELVAARPEVRFVLDHLGKPRVQEREIEPWRTHIRRLSQFENVAVKVSGMIPETESPQWSVDGLRPYFDIVLESFGSDRLIFGSNWPVCTLGATYGEVVDSVIQLSSDLSEIERVAILGDNARRWYQLDLG